MRLSSSVGGNGRKINILICSGNMGNQQPDRESLAAWIPQDGSVREVVMGQKYPVVKESSGAKRLKSALNGKHLVNSKNGSANPQSHEIDEEDIDQEHNKSFDIIVIGMQEATFEVENNPPTANGSSESLISLRHATHNIAGRAKKATKAVAELTMAKDHLKASHRTSPRFHFRKTSRENSSELSVSDGPDRASMLHQEGSAIFSQTSPGLSKLESSIRYSSVVNSEDGSILDESRNHESQLPRTDTKVLHDMLQGQLPSYKHSVSYQRGQMRLMIFHKEDQITMEIISVKAQNTGKGGLANKGGIVAEILVDNTRLSFMTAHLEAHEGVHKYETRCSTIADIFRGTASSSAAYRCDASLASHFTFAMGDLNFRTRIPSHEPGSESHIATTHELAELEDWQGLNYYDELQMALKENHCLSGFSTPPCMFPPTFKLERRPGYVYNPKRSPSYTDRILFFTNHRLNKNLKLAAYEPIDNCSSSDHKPIRGAFEVRLNESLKWRPTIIKTQSLRFNTKPRLLSRLSSLSTASGQKAESSDKREFLNLFVSSVEVELHKDHYRKGSDFAVPSPFVSFMSTPEDALKKASSRWENWKGSIIAHRSSLAVGKKVSADWPHTQIKHDSFHVEWEDQLHFKVRTHYDDGRPIDLSGALIHVNVFDGKTHDLMGIFPLNLAYLITMSRGGSKLKKTKPQSSLDRTPSSHRPSLLRRLVSTRNTSKCTIPEAKPESKTNETEVDHHSDEDDDGYLTKGPSSELVQLVSDSSQRRKHFRLSKELRKASTRINSTRSGGSSSAKEDLDFMDVFSMKIDQPLRMHGVAVGRIKFTVDAWWLTDEDAKKRAQRK